MVVLFFFFFNDTATTEIYTLSLHDALPICLGRWGESVARYRTGRLNCSSAFLISESVVNFFPITCKRRSTRSEEHTSELQSRQYLVCRLLLEKKKKTTTTIPLAHNNQQIRI